MLFLLVVPPPTALPPLLSVKALAPLVASGGKSAFGQMSATLSPQLPASEIKQTFLSPNPACLLALVQ